MSFFILLMINLGMNVIHSLQSHYNVGIEDSALISMMKMMGL